MTKLGVTIEESSQNLVSHTVSQVLDSLLHLLRLLESGVPIPGVLPLVNKVSELH